MARPSVAPPGAGACFTSSQARWLAYSACPRRTTSSGMRRSWMTKCCALLWTARSPHQGRQGPPSRPLTRRTRHFWKRLSSWLLAGHLRQPAPLRLASQTERTLRSSSSDWPTTSCRRRPWTSWLPSWARADTRSSGSSAAAMACHPWLGCCSCGCNVPESASLRAGDLLTRLCPVASATRAISRVCSPDSLDTPRALGAGRQLTRASTTQERSRPPLRRSASCGNDFNHRLNVPNRRYPSRLLGSGALWRCDGNGGYIGHCKQAHWSSS